MGLGLFLSFSTDGHPGCRLVQHLDAFDIHHLLAPKRFDGGGVGIGFRFRSMIDSVLQCIPVFRWPTRQRLFSVGVSYTVKKNYFFCGYAAGPTENIPAHRLAPKSGSEPSLPVCVVRCSQLRVEESSNCVSPRHVHCHHLHSSCTTYWCRTLIKHLVDVPLLIRRDLKLFAWELYFLMRDLKLSVYEDIFS